MKSAQRPRIVGLRQCPFLPARANYEDVGPALGDSLIKDTSLFARVALDRSQPPGIDFVITAKRHHGIIYPQHIVYRRAMNDTHEGKQELRAAANRGDL